jgi:hypothetical protein
MKRRLSDRADSTRTRPGHADASEDEACSDDSCVSSYKVTPKRKTRKKYKSRHDPTEHGKHTINHSSNASHSRSSHDIRSPSPIRAALLRWYAGVHTSRGMPWRKSYDPSQGIEERAQRAYEVCFVSRILSIIDYLVGMGVGDHASANPGLHGYPLLYPLDGKVRRGLPPFASQT